MVYDQAAADWQREASAAERRVTIARIVAQHWAPHIFDAGYRHALTCVMAALGGETDPEELGVDGPDADRIRAAVEQPSAAPQPPADGGGTCGSPGRC